MHDVPSRDAGARLDFLTQFRDDVAAEGPRTLADYHERFPELGDWLTDEYPRLCAELRVDRSRAPDDDETELVDFTDDARLVAELEARRGDAVRYRRAGELGRGGTSRVFSVRDVELGRDVAMKVLQRDGASSLRRFLREARITSRLEHPGVLPVHELGLDARGELYFTMRLVRGRSLKALFDELRDDPRRLRRRTAIEALLKVCDTMAFAHAQGVIHRDLKPSNVMLGDYGEVYVVDWGLARALGSGDEPASVGGVEAGLDPVLGTLAGDVLGTPAYMPPEQASGDHARVGTASDVYSAGAMLYHLLAGRAPYIDGQSTPDSRAVLARVLDGPPPELAALAPEAPPELVAIARRAMARAPSERYPTCAEMAADLRGFLEERIVLAHSSGPWVRATKWVRRNRALSAVLGVSLLLAVGAALGWSQAKAKEANLDLLATLRGPVELLLDFDALWPASEARREALETWLARAEELRAAVPKLEALVDDMRRSGERLPLPPWLLEREVEKRATLLVQASAAIQRTKSQMHNAEFKLADDPNDEDAEAEIKEHRAAIASMEREQRVIQARQPTRVTWVFADPQTQLLHDRVDAFLSEFELACGRTKETSEVMLVRAALGALDRERKLDADADGWQRAWDDATRRIAEAPRYAGLALARQAHLWPLGPDPDTGLWEFAHTLTGAVPVRGADGRLALDATSALVLVLVPGTEDLIVGSQNADPSGPCFDRYARPEEGPLLTTPLDAYFIGKHEVDGAQWERMTSEPVGTLWGVTGEPGFGAAQLPAANMTGVWGGVALRAFGLTLPTSARWEYAARAGTQTAWWTGEDAESLADAANVADAQWLRVQRRPKTDLVGAVEFDDSEYGHAGIGCFRPNAFGLYDVVGNVAEWCFDRTEPRMWLTIPPENGLFPRANGLQIVRGGSYKDSALEGRSGARWYMHPEFNADWIGLRAARSIELQPSGSR